MKKKIFTIISILLLICSHFISLGNLGQSNTAVIGTFVATLLLWITVDITWPSLLCLISLAFIPEVGIKTALSSSFGNETFAFLLFTFMCTYAISQTSFIKRTALFFITSSFAKKGPWQMSILFFLAVLLMGLFISPTVLFFIFYPILQEIYDILGLKKGDSFAAMLIMGLILCSNLSAGMTPIAHVFPVLAMGVFSSLTGQTINYGEYMLFGIPTGLILFTLMMLIFKFIMKPSLPQFAGLSKEDFTEGNLGKISKKEVATLIVFMFVVLLWVLPSLISSFLPTIASYISGYGTAMPPLLGVVLMAIIKVDNQALVNVNESIVKGVSWPSLIMSSATLLLGACLTNEKIGFIHQITTMIKPITSSLAPWILILFFIIWASLESNISSHMVTAQVVPSVAIPVALVSVGLISPAAITAVIGMGASLGSATPPSMPFVAVACSSEWITTQAVLKYGLIFTVVVILCLYLIGYPLANLIM